MLSVSSGSSRKVNDNIRRRFKSPFLDWGLAQWAPYLVDLFVMSTSQCTHWSCKVLLGKAYHRLDPELDTHVAMDDVDAMPLLHANALKVDLTETRDWLIANGYTHISAMRGQGAATTATSTSSSGSSSSKPAGKSD